MSEIHEDSLACSTETVARLIKCDCSWPKHGTNGMRKHAIQLALEEEWLPLHPDLNLKN